MTPRSILDDAVRREPLAGHDGKSGAALERVVLADGRRVVVKRLDPATDLMMSLTHDPVGVGTLLDDIGRRRSRVDHDVWASAPESRS